MAEKSENGSISNLSTKVGGAQRRISDWVEPDVLTTKPEALARVPGWEAGKKEKWVPELGALDEEVGERWLFHGTGGAGLVAESGRPGRAELLAKKGRIVGGVGCPPNCRTSGKLRGSSAPLELFRKMPHFGKIPKTFGQNLAKIQQNSGKICDEIFETRELCSPLSLKF